MAHLLTAGTPDRPKRAAWRETPTAEALAFDRWRFSSALGGIPGEARIVRPGAFGLFFDCPPPLTFLDPATGQPREGAIEDGGIAVLHVTGPLEHQESWWWANYHAIKRETAAALAWPTVRAVVLKIDSPGGVCAGMLACHRALRDLRALHRKPLVAFVDELAASAAYGLASACEEIWLPPEGSVGSIGVILCTIDETERQKKDGIAVRYVVTGDRKADLQPGAAVTDEVLRVAQAKVDELGVRFFEAVAIARGQKASDIEALEAAVFMGEAAVSVGLADGVADWADFLGTLRGSLGATFSGARGTVTPTRSTGDDMQTKMQLVKAQQEAEAAVRVAQAAVAVAKGDAITPAAKALADALARRAEAAAKVVHYKKLEEKTVEHEEKDKAEKEPMSEEPETKPSEAAEAMNSASDMPDSGEGDEEARIEKALVKAYSTGTAALRGTALDHYGPRALLALSEKALGVKGARAVIGALSALPERLAAVAKVERDVQKLKSESRAQRIDRILRDPANASKVGGKKHREHLRAEGMKNGTAWLAGHLAVAPVVLRSEHEGPIVPQEGDDGRGQFRGETAEQAKILAQITAQMTPEQRAEFEKDFTARLAQTQTKVPAV